MDIFEIIKDAVMFPMSDLKKVITLGIFPAAALLITILIAYIVLSVGSYTALGVAGIIGLIITLLAYLFVGGYVFRTIQATIAGSNELPEFEDWDNLFIDGLKIAVVEIIYLIIPIAVILIGAGASILAGSISMNALLGGLGITVLIGVLLAIIFELIAAIAIANMALNDGELGAAFRFSEVMEKISDIGWGNYIIWYILMIIVGAVINFIGGIIGIIPFIGGIISALVITPYLALVYGRSLALLFGTTIEKTPDE